MSIQCQSLIIFISRNSTILCNLCFFVPSRDTLKKDIMELFYDERIRIHKLVDSNKGTVAITINMWTTSNQRKAYMVVTTHC
ncbi:hypothetical protein LINPERPRIM_LOCUS36391 [Linum perenne]